MLRTHDLLKSGITVPFTAVSSQSHVVWNPITA